MRISVLVFFEKVIIEQVAAVKRLTTLHSN